MAENVETGAILMLQFYNQIRKADQKLYISSVMPFNYLKMFINELHVTFYIPVCLLF